MLVRIVRIIVIFVITFLARQFLVMLFDLIKTSFRKKKDISGEENKTEQIIETEFVDENENESGNGNGNGDKKL